MAYIKEYWSEKEKRANTAKKHTEEMDEKYADDIKHSIDNTVIYTDEISVKPVENKEMDIKVTDEDSVLAIFNNANKKTAVLNFASYKNAGGMFLNGSKAQEECLCHESFLYNVLRTFKEKYYDINNKAKNKALYLNKALYSPDVLFIRNNKSIKCDVITCAAPNKSAAQKYCNVTDAQNYKVLKSRIKYVLDIAQDNNVDTLILGAYGAGVFGQDPVEVAKLFKEELKARPFEKVIFAILPGPNYTAFKSVI